MCGLEAHMHSSCIQTDLLSTDCAVWFMLSISSYSFTRVAPVGRISFHGYTPSSELSLYVKPLSHCKVYWETVLAGLGWAGLAPPQPPFQSSGVSMQQSAHEVMVKNDWALHRNVVNVCRGDNALKLRPLVVSLFRRFMFFNLTLYWASD